MRRKLIIPLIILCLLSGCDMTGRAARAISSIPSVVRTLFPNASPTTLGLLDTAAATFNEFVNNKTASSYQRALNAWNEAKGELLRFNNQKLNTIVAAVDILLGQISSPASDARVSSSDSKLKVKFKESDVKRLEDALK